MWVIFTQSTGTNRLNSSRKTIRTQIYFLILSKVVIGTEFLKSASAISLNIKKEFGKPVNWQFLVPYDISQS